MLQTIDQIKGMVSSSKKGQSGTTAEAIQDKMVKSMEKKSERINPTMASETEISDTDIVKAACIIDSDKVLVRYIRGNKQIMKQEKPNGIVNYSIVPGSPTACLVAFMDDIGMHIGWSKRNNSKQPSVVNVRNEVIKWENVEPVPYTKKVGTQVAVLRALTDKIHIESERRYITETEGTSQKSTQIKERRLCFDDSGNYLPSDINNEIPAFVERAQRWFKQNNDETPINVSYMNTVKNQEQVSVA